MKRKNKEVEKGIKKWKKGNKEEIKFAGEIMTNIKICMVHEVVAVQILSSANPSRSICDIIKDLEDIKNKKDRAVNLDDARKLEELAIELIRMSRDTLVCCS
jgi:hypothetical protein